MFVDFSKALGHTNLFMMSRTDSVFFACLFLTSAKCSGFLAIMYVTVTKTFTRPEMLSNDQNDIKLCAYQDMSSVWP